MTRKLSCCARKATLVRPLPPKRSGPTTAVSEPHVYDAQALRRPSEDVDLLSDPCTSSRHHTAKAAGETAEQTG
jgi:hypothetical protein